MTKELAEISENQRVIIALREFQYFAAEIKKDKKDYAKYKQGDLSNLNNQRTREMEIILLLEQLGYPMDEIGTYFYKNMIVKVVNYLEGISRIEDKKDYEKIMSQLKNGFSQFYLEVARNDLDIGIKTFHKYIEEAIEKIDYSKTNPTIALKIFGNVSEELDYGEQAFIIGNYIVNNCISRKNIMPKVKKLI